MVIYRNYSGSEFKSEGKERLILADEMVIS